MLRTGKCCDAEAAMSRGVFVLGIGVALIALGLALTVWGISLRPGLSEANVKRIGAGMTVEEVRGLLGELREPTLRRDGLPPMMGSDGVLVDWEDLAVFLRDPAYRKLRNWRDYPSVCVKVPYDH
jgi:hypothetical protein